MRLARAGEEVSFAEPDVVGEDGIQPSAYQAIFSTMTSKQHDVFVLLAENRTSKDIAYQLGISESAVIKRIQSIRTRTGFPPRSDLARAYAKYLQSRTSPGDNDMFSHALSQAAPGLSLWQRGAADWILPGALVGPNAGLNRFAAMVVIAVGLLFVALASLGIAQAVANFP